MYEWFRRFSARTATAAGSPWAFFLASFSVVCWALTGPSFNFSDTWQIVINTGTTIVTFLMVFLVQATQNRDAQALHLKLDALVLASKNAHDALAFLEEASDAELKRVREMLKASRQ